MNTLIVLVSSVDKKHTNNVVATRTVVVYR